jgi:hypothetical protein
MGGMVLTGAMARNEETATRVRSCALLGSGCFLEGASGPAGALGRRARLGL